MKLVFPTAPISYRIPPLSGKARQAPQRGPTTGPAPSEETCHQQPPQPISPGQLVVLAIDPCATLSPFFPVDPSLERRMRGMETGMKRYLAFARHVETPASSKRQDNLTIEEQRVVGGLSPDTGVGPSTKAADRRTHLHLSLLHHKQPKRSRYDSIDESMCVPLEWNGQHRKGHQGASQNSSPRRKSFGDERAPLRIDGPTESLIPTSCRALYAYTTVDVTAAVSSSDVGVEKAFSTSLVLSEHELQRFDVYKTMDRLRQEEEREDEATSESGEADEDCELSTVISGLSMTSRGGVRIHMGGTEWDPTLLSPTTAASKEIHNVFGVSDPSNSTQPTTVPSYNPSLEDDEHFARGRGAERLEPWSVGRQCILHVRVWLDVDNALRHGKPADPRGLLEDVRQLRTLACTTEVQTTLQAREFAAARVAAWRQTPANGSVDHVSWPNTTSCPNNAIKTIKNAWKKLTCRAK